MEQMPLASWIPDKAFFVRMKEAIELPTTRYLWIPADQITFKPAILKKSYGDGRALFWISSINQRPQFWVVRGDSAWSTCDSMAPDDAPEFIDFVDDILTDLEEEFGSARCGYSGACLRYPAEERDCDCEECSDPRVSEWPEVDGDGGLSWGRYRWPEAFSTVPHPFAHWTILAEQEPRGGGDGR